MKLKFKKKINFILWAKVLFPINRSLTGLGNIKTLKLINIFSNKKFKIKFFKTNQKFFDWKIPKEWRINNAYIKDENDIHICNFKNNNLHVVGYSQPINKKIKLNETKKNIFFNKNRPRAIPYVTSYYKKLWGFCISYNQYKKMLPNKKYHFFIDSKFLNGKMHYSELVIKGKSKKEILICSYICHPSMANNELSGPLIVTALAKYLRPSKYTVRLLLIPETIGAVAYISKNLDHLKKNLVAGFNLTCCGDDNELSYIRSKEENTYADKIMKRLFPNIKSYNFIERGSNERQFGCQNLNLPFITICRSKFGKYREYHTSDDNLNYINNSNLNDTFKKVIAIINEIQDSKIYIKQVTCEPFISKYNFSENMSTKESKDPKFWKNIREISGYTEKNFDEKELSKLLKINLPLVKRINQILEHKKIIKQFI